MRRRLERCPLNPCCKMQVFTRQTWADAMEFARQRVASGEALFRPQVQQKPDGRWNIWWVVAGEL